MSATSKKTGTNPTNIKNDPQKTKTNLKVRALVMFSGGLDSILVAKLLLEQGLDVEGITFRSPFFGSEKAEKAAKQSGLKGFKLTVVELGPSYFEMVRQPKHGYGSAINPCVDCKIFMLKKAKQYAKKSGAKFIATGEVLGQRPMSQRHPMLIKIAKEAGLVGKILRPLSAKLLPETESEQEGWVNRERFFEIQGRGRETQIKLAKKFKLTYPGPAGGCLLCEKDFAVKLQDLFARRETRKLSVREVELLKFGRHFEFNGCRIIVGRNHPENEKLIGLKTAKDCYFEVPDVGSPITILQLDRAGSKAKNEAIKLAAQLTARYADTEERKVLVKYGCGLEKEKFDQEIKVEQLGEEEIKELRLSK